MDASGRVNTGDSWAEFFDKLGVPMPAYTAYFTTTNGVWQALTYLDYWSACMEWPVLQAAFIFAITGLIGGSYIGAFFYLRSLKMSGESMDWSFITNLGI